MMIILFSLLIGLGHAGDFKGNGGGAIQCPGAPLEILDFYEARQQNLGEPNLGNRTAISELKQVYLQRLAVHSPVLSKQFSEMFDKFESESVFLDSVPMENIDDLGVQLPANCQWRQIVNQNPLLLPPGKNYLVDRGAWSELGALQRTGLIFHELLYRQAKSETSKGLRHINALNSVDRLNVLSLSQRFALWKEAGMLWMEAQGLSFQMGENVVIANETLLSATPVANSLFHWQGHDIAVAAKPVQFHSNGAIRTLGNAKDFEIDFYGARLTVNAWDIYQQQMEFYPSGLLKSASVNGAAKYHKGPHFELWFHHLTYDSAGRLESLIDAGGTVEIRGQIYRVYRGQDLSFHPNGMVKTFAWGVSVDAIPVKYDPFVVWGQIIYPAPGSTIVFDSEGQLQQFRAGVDGRLETPQGQGISFQKNSIVNLRGL